MGDPGVSFGCDTILNPTLFETARELASASNDSVFWGRDPEGPPDPLTPQIPEHDSSKRGWDSLPGGDPLGTSAYAGGKHASSPVGAELVFGKSAFPGTRPANVAGIRRN
jgi:hypothetical protein